MALAEDEDSSTSEKTPLFLKNRDVENEAVWNNMDFEDKYDETSVLLDDSEIRSYRAISTTGAETRSPVTLTWNQLCVDVVNRKKKDTVQILCNLTGIVYPGQLLALMGSSGAGKTTLLNTLVQRNLQGLRVTGSVQVNGSEVSARQMTDISAYVQQDDLFIPTLTVREHLLFQAHLRLAKTIDNVNKRRRVDEVISQLGLRKCQNRRIGTAGIARGISGGEAKRLAFASEILTNPALLFCDEPTTGLDSYMAESVVKVLEKLAQSGKTVICTIHQPASQVYALFDQVCFLANGRSAFFGHTSQTLDFFAKQGYQCPDDFNPADFIIHTLAIVPSEREECKQRVSAISDTYDQSEYGSLIETMVQRVNCAPAEDWLVTTEDGRASSNLVKFSTLFHRAALDNLRSPGLARAKIMQKIIMGLFIGLLYLNTPINQVAVTNINGALFYLIADFTYAALFGILRFMPEDFPLVVREHHNGMYAVLPYYAAKILSYLPLFSLDGMLLLSICYFMVGFRSASDAFFIALLIGFCIEQVSMACGIMISSIAPSFPIAVSIVGPFMTLISLTGGFYANVGTLPVYISWIQYMSWFKYGFEALSVNQWHLVHNITCLPTDLTCLTSGDQVLAKYNFNSDNMWLDILLMVVLSAVFYLVGFISLSFRVYKSR